MLIWFGLNKDVVLNNFGLSYEIISQFYQWQLIFNRLYKLKPMILFLIAFCDFKIRETFFQHYFQKYFYWTQINNSLRINLYKKYGDQILLD